MKIEFKRILVVLVAFSLSMFSLQPASANGSPDINFGSDGIFQLDSFLIIGVIAAVRHILTVGASLTMEKEKTTEYFNRSLIEMGVNTGIVLALVFALFLSRAARKASPKNNS